MSEDEIGRRAAERVRKNEPALIQNGEQVSPAALVNISRGGARVRLLAPGGFGPDIELIWADIKVSGRVVWRSASAIGIRFDALLPASRVERSRKDGVPRAAVSDASEALAGAA